MSSDSLPIHLVIGDHDPIDLGELKLILDADGENVDFTISKAQLALALREAADVLDPPRRSITINVSTFDNPDAIRHLRNAVRRRPPLGPPIGD